MPILMDAVQGAKEIADLVKKYNDIPLYEKIVALQGQIVTQASQLVALSEENLRLKEQARQKIEIKFVNPYFYEAGNEVPLCPKCYSDKNIRSYLSHPPKDFTGGNGRSCRICKEFYREGPRSVPLQAKQTRWHRSY